MEIIKIVVFLHSLIWSAYSVLNSQCLRGTTPLIVHSTGLGHRLMDTVVGLFLSDYLGSIYIPNINHFHAHTFHESFHGYEEFFLTSGLHLFHEKLSNYTDLLTNQIQLKDLTDNSILFKSCDYLLLYKFTDCWDIRLPKIFSNTSSCFLVNTFPIIANACSTYRYWFQLQYFLRERPWDRILLTCSQELKTYADSSSCVLPLEDQLSPFVNHCKHLCKNESVYKVAIHLRLGDYVMNSNIKYYQHLAHSINSLLHEVVSYDLAIHFFFFSSGTQNNNITTSYPPDSHSFLSNIELFKNATFLNLDTMTTIGDAMASDLFIASGSSFAVIPYFYGHKNAINAFPKEGARGLQWSNLCTSGLECCLDKYGDLKCFNMESQILTAARVHKSLLRLI
jgi:hypothetical protein